MTIFPMPEIGLVRLQAAVPPAHPSAGRDRRQGRDASHRRRVEPSEMRTAGPSPFRSVRKAFPAAMATPRSRACVTKLLLGARPRAAAARDAGSCGWHDRRSSRPAPRRQAHGARASARRCHCASSIAVPSFTQWEAIGHGGRRHPVGDQMPVGDGRGIASGRMEIADPQARNGDLGEAGNVERALRRKRCDGRRPVRDQTFRMSFSMIARSWRRATSTSSSRRSAGIIVAMGLMTVGCR